MLDCSPAGTTRSIFAQLFKTRFTGFASRTLARGISPRHEGQPQVSLDHETVREVASAEAFLRAGFGEMGKRCVRMAAVAVAAGLLVLASVQSSQAQTVFLNIGTSTVATLTGFTGFGGISVDSVGNIFVGNGSTGTAVKLTLSGGVYQAPVTIASGLAGPSGISEDPSGNVFVSCDSNNTIVKIPYSNGSYGTPVTLTSAVSGPNNIFVDGSGNIFIPESGSASILKMTYSGGTYSAPVAIGSGFSNPQGVKADLAGNVYVADENNHAVKKIPFSGGVYGTPISIGSGFTSPVGVAVDISGNVYVADVGLNEVLKIPFSGGVYGTPIAVGSGFSYPGDVLVDLVGNVYEVDGGTSTVKEIDFLPPPIGSVNVNSSSSLTLTYDFGTGGTIKAPVVLTQGATGLDFTDSGTGTCTTNGTSHSYAAGSTCTVIVTFKPKAPGLRMGAVELLNSAGTVLTTTFIQGRGTGPETVFANTTTGVYLPSAQNTLGGGFSNPEAAAVDVAGNVYVADFSNSVVKEMPAGCASSSCVTILGSGFGNPTGVAVDGAGNVYVADFGHSLVKEMVAVGGSIPASPTINTLGGGFSQAEGVAVDGNGNVFVGDTSHNAVKEIPSGCSSSSCVTTLVSGFSNPSGVAVDGRGNVFVADTNNSAVKEIPSGCATSSCVTTLGSGFGSPQGVAVDGSGDIYVADTGHATAKKIVAVGGSIPASPTILTLGSGFGLPFGVAVDGTGNVYVADNTNNAVKKLDFADPPSFTFANTYVDSVSADSPKTETITNIGNTALTFEVPGVGDNPAISAGFTIGNSSTCPQLSTTSGAGTLAAGASCTDLISFAPQVVGTISGSTVTTDNTLNVANTTQSVGLSGTSLALLTKTITFPQPATPVSVNSTATLTATTSNSDPVTYSITSGAATINGSTITYTTAGTVVIAANSAQTSTYAAAATVSQTVVVNPAASFYTAPTEAVGSSSGTQTAIVNFTAAGTLGSINVVTKGAPNLDFKYVTGGTCAVGQTYTAGEACTVLYSFTPLYPGAREGAVVLETSGGTVLGTSYLGGTGTAPLGLFTTTSQTLNVTGLNGARGLSADGYGNLYVMETGNGKVDEIAAGTNTVTTLTTLGTGTAATAVDGAGNLYVGIEAAGIIYELVGGKAPAITLVTGTCGNDDNLETDGAGNLYFSCYNGGAIYKVNTGSHSLTQLLAGGSGHRFIGMAADAAGNIYAPDFNNNILFELPYGANSLTTLVTGGSLSNPHGVAVDPAGNIYVTNINGSNILRYAAGTYGLTVLPAAGQRGIAIDGAGDLYTLTTDTTIAEYTRTTAPGLTFPNTPVGTSSNSLQTVEFENDGNAPLAITSYSATTNFNVGGAGNTCATGSLASGATCSVGAVLAPTAVGSLTGTASIVDNTLGVAGTSQNIPLSGTATQATPVITWATPLAITYGTALSGTQLNASSTVAGTYSYNPVAGTVLGAGSHTLSVTFTPTDGTDYTTATSTVTLQVNPATPTVTWATPSAITYGTALSGTQLNASSTVAGTYSYNPASGTVLGAGSHQLSVTFTPTDGTDYTTATSTVMLQVNQATPAITWPTPAAITYGTTLSGTQLNASSTVAGTYSYNQSVGTVLGAGSYTLSVTFTPTDGTDYTTATSTAALLVNQAKKAIIFPALASPVAVNSTATLAATASNGDPISYSITSGAATINGTTITFTNAGTVTIAADSAATVNYLAATTVSDTVVVNAAPSSYTAPTEPVGSTTATQTATVNLTTAGMLSAINVVTQGASGLDFNVASGGTCAVGTVYTAGQACTVEYSFTPQVPGTRLGAITLVSDSGAGLGTSYLGGTGTGPLAIFSNGGQSVFQNSTTTLNAITTDASGNVYYSTYQPGNVYKIAAGTGITTQLASGLSTGSGVAIDGAGNVFYSDYGANTVNELVGGTGTPIVIASEPNPEGLAVDLQGNLYVAVSGNQNVVKLLAGSFTPSTTYGTGINYPQSVAVDAAGNVYITDLQGSKAVVVTPDGATQTTIATGISTPVGITLDTAGNIYIAAYGSGEVEEFAPAPAFTPTTLGSFTNPVFVALDPSGNILVVDRGSNSNIDKLTRATPALLSFATTPEGSTSSDSPQTITLSNDGNASLVLSGLSASSSYFSLSGSSTCSSTTTLASNGACNIGVTFAPTVPGSPLTDAVTITDNNLNIASAVQSVPLTGTGTQQTATITVAPATISYTTTPTTLSATVAYLGTTAPSGAVSFTIDGGGAVPATCVGSSSPLTCTASYVTGTLSATTHTITATLAADTDYTTASGSAALTVMPIAPTITFAVPNHTYGDAAVTLAATSNSGAAITYSVVSGPATVTGSTLSITGAGPVTVQAAQIAAGNYIAGSQNASFTIAPLTLSAAIVGNPTKSYDNTTAATLTSANYQLSPLVGSDAISVTQPSGVYASVTAGPEGVTAALSAANFSAVSGLLTNYSLPTVATGTGTINPAALTVTVNPASSIYGVAFPAFSGTLSGVVAGDGITASYSTTATPTSPVGGSYSITALLNDPNSKLSNYTVTNTPGTLTINPATPTITWPAQAAITYGTALSGAQLNATASVAGTFSYNPASGVLTAGLHLLSVTFTPTDGTDYTTASSTVTLQVNQATPTITWPTPAPFAYGTALSGTQLNATASVAGTFSYNPAGGVLTAGSHLLSVTFTPTDTADNTTATATVNLTVSPSALTITAGSPTTIYGSTLPAIAPSYSGFIPGDSASSLTTQPTCTTTATSASNVGSYPTSCSGAVDTNYVISYKPGTLTVTPAVLTVAANKLTFAYGGGDGDNDADSVANPLTYTITGFALGQTAATDLTGKPSETSNTPEGGPVGSYIITVAAGSLKLKPAYSSDYTISYVSAPLTITPAVLTVTATSQSNVYGSVDTDNCGHPERHQTYTVSGFAYGQNQNQVLDGSPTETTTATAKSGVGTYPITITQGSLALKRNYANNYTLVFVNGTLTVTPAKLYVVANSYSRPINQPNPVFAYTIKGFVNGDNQSSATTGTPACCSTTAVTSSPAGLYAITIAAGSLAAKNGNYTLNFVNGVLVVYNPRDRNDAHCDGNGNYNSNRQFDHDNWPDSSSYNYYWSNGGGGPNINNWNW